MWNGSTKLIVPYAAWMALMSVLPSTPWAYAVRAVVTAVLLAFWLVSTKGISRLAEVRWGSSLVWGVVVGVTVLVIWVLPEQFDWPWYRRFFIIGEGGTDAIAESNACLIAIRLLGSAFVISLAEELFFRKWLIGFAGFWWMVALFAIEHDRYLVGAIAGVAYGVLYLRKGLLAAVIAHALTNLLLGFWVLTTGQWQFW